MVRALLYWFPVKCKSFERLKDLALTILILSKKAKRYKIHLWELEIIMELLRDHSKFTYKKKVSHENRYFA